MTPVVSVVVVTLGDEALLGPCLDALDVAVAELGETAEQIVVLNGGPAALADGLGARADELRVLQPGRNAGFAGGAQLGIAAARGRWVALVNDDAVVDRRFLAELLAAGEADDKIGAVAGVLRFMTRPEVINSAGLEVDRLGVARDARLGEPFSSLPAVPHPVFGASGGAALLRSEMLAQTGGFDPGFFAYLEDADLAWRARAAGWRTVCAPGAHALHHHSATVGHGSRRKDRLVGRNRVRLLARNASRAQLRRNAPAIVLHDAAHVAFALIRDRNPAPLAGRMEGLAQWRVLRRARSGPELDPQALLPPFGVADAMRRRRAWRGP